MIDTTGLTEFEISYLNKFVETLKNIREHPQDKKTLSMGATSDSDGVTSLYLSRNYNGTAVPKAVHVRDIRRVEYNQDLYATYKNLTDCANRYVEIINSTSSNSLSQHSFMMCTSNKELENNILDILASIENYTRILEEMAQPIEDKMKTRVNSELSRVLGVDHE